MIQPASVHNYSRGEESSRDIVDPERMEKLAATLDRTWDGGPSLPPLAHFLLFRPSQRQSLLGPDGHPLRGAGGVMADVDLPRRMWAGSTIAFHRPLMLGEPVTRRSRLVAAQEKAGRSGAMLFCTVEHSIAGADADTPAIVERQDIVYREAHRGPGEALRPAVAAEWEPAQCQRRRIDTVMLFRYSALTFNSHRIHYDRPYAMSQEGYGGLVVHGPLLATLMLDHLERMQPGRIVRTFAFRAVSPVLDGEEISIGSIVDGENARLSITSPVGLAMSASVTFAP